MLPTLGVELKKKSDAMCNALDKYFGSAANYQKPDGGIFIWVDMPENVDTSRLIRYCYKTRCCHQSWSMNGPLIQAVNIK